MDITRIIIKNLTKHYQSQKDILDLMRHPEKLSKVLKDHSKLLPLIDESELIEELLPKSFGLLTSQIVKIEINQLDQNFKPIDKTKIEVNSLCIEDISLDLNAGGFNGEAIINLPYSTKIPEEYGILFQNQPLQVELKITSEYKQDQAISVPNQKSVNNILNLTGMVNLKNGIKHNYIFNDKLQQKYKSTQSLSKPYIKISISFTDILTALWDEHYAVSIYPEKCYQDVFDDINQNYSRLINLEYDDSAEALALTRPFITVNCDYQNKYSSYDFLISVLDGYGLSLFYNYTLNSYQIIDAKVWIEQLEQINLDEKNRASICEVTLTTSKQCRDISLFDTNYKLSESFAIKSKPIEQWNESVSFLPKHQVSHLINDDIKEEANQIKEKHCNSSDTSHDSKINPPIWLKSDVAPLYDLPVQPMALVKFDENTESLTYQSKGFPIVLLMRSKFDIRPTPLWQELRNNWSATKESLDLDKKHNLSRSLFINDHLNMRPALLFNYTVEQSMWFKSSIMVSLPRKPRVQPTLLVEAELYTTSNDEKQNTQNHLLFDLYESKITTANTSSSGKIYGAGLQECLHGQCYLFNFPQTLLPKSIEASPFLIPINIFEGNKTPNIFSLLKSGTRARLEVSREKSQVNTILNYQVPEQIFSEGDTKQNHYINFENREEIQAYISHEYNLSESASSLNIASNQENSARLLMLSDKKIQMKYQLKS